METRALADRVAELEDLVERLLAVQEHTVTALDWLIPAAPVPATTRPALRVIVGGDAAS